MRAPFVTASRVVDTSPATRRAILAALAIGLAIVGTNIAEAESDVSELVILPGTGLTGSWLDRPESLVPPIEMRDTEPPAPIAEIAAKSSNRTGLREINFQAPPADTSGQQSLQLDLVKNPCAAMDEKPLQALGIGIEMPAGKLPNEPAAPCWDQLNQSAGPLASVRCWPMHVYNWCATGVCHRPLYFEQINLERHGYGCCEPLQPLASAAHFFATVPALPYCMAVECPCECVYTLGHYRPGSCPPWRCHWPPCSPLAAAAEGGVWTGMIFLIP